MKTPPQPPKSGTRKTTPRTTPATFDSFTRYARKPAPPGPVRFPERPGEHAPRVTPENVGNMTNSQWQQLHGSDTKGK